ncbi:MAG: putative lipid II flippase FtsW [Lachnospiraceae bacterium]|nr:putative lipid II flippase FtsW [Lachnospiraceae bacterium]
MAKKKKSGGLFNSIKEFFQELFIKSDYVDYPLMFVTLFLVVFGLVMVYSTSSYTAELKLGQATYYLVRQGMFALLGVCVMLFISRMDYHFLKKFSVPLMLVVIVLLVALPFVGVESHGAVRWINIFGFQFQPSEFAKPIIALFTAHIASIKSARIGELKIMAKVLILPVIAIVLITSENLSTGIICTAIACVIVFVTSPKVKQFLVIGGILVCVMIGFLLVASYRLERIDIWLNPEKYDSGYQTLQSLYAIGSGGLFGKGLGQSIQKLGFIPESHNDYIFSVVCEELGLFGAICVIGMFMFLIWRCVIIAVNTEDLYGALIVVGIITHIAVQVLVNIAVVTNSIPPTGVPLPFISYGGTALVCVLAEVGIVLSVSRHLRVAKEY